MGYLRQHVITERAMTGLTKRWHWRNAETSDGGPIPGEGLAERVLRVRGLRESEAIERFCDPKLTDLHDPALLPMIDKAAERMTEAIRKRESIVIYGDYDVDGITATAILYHVIKTVEPEARIGSYVPHRVDEGYGLSADALLKLREEGADLVISVDCGATARQPAKAARDAGLDLIITDHHSIPNEVELLPECFALVHPRSPGSEYPFGDLCGAGVAFKLAWRLATLWCGSERVTGPLQQTLLHMLPLVALGTIADVAPLLGENRVLTTFGLRLIRQTPVVGLRALIEASGLMDEKIDSEKVGFQLAPRLNACGRMGHARDAMRMLTDAPPDEAMQIAHNLTKLNRERQTVERRIFEQASQRAEELGMTRDDCRAIVLADPSWHPGVVGIVCSRLVERYHRPTILMNQSHELCRGSARSIDCYSIHAALAHTAEYLTTWGGHDVAAGLSLATTRLDAFVAALTAHANENITVEQLTPGLTIDCDAALEELDVAQVKRLNGLGPFGRGNARPALRVDNVQLIETPRQMGSGGKHLDLRCAQDTAGGSRRIMRCIWWREGSRAADFAPGMRLDLAIQPKLNEWNGRTSAEAEIRDVRIVPRTEW